MDKTCRMSGVGTKMETQEGKFKIVQNLLVNEIMVIIFLFFFLILTLYSRHTGMEEGSHGKRFICLDMFLAEIW